MSSSQSYQTILFIDKKKISLQPELNNTMFMPQKQPYLIVKFMHYSVAGQ